MKRATLLLNLIGAIAVMAVAIGCTTPKQKEDLVSAAGFKMMRADTLQQRATLTALPSDRVLMTERNGQNWFLFASPANNVLYVGGDRQYHRYQRLRVEKGFSREPVNPLALNLAEPLQSAWGPW